MAPKILFVLTSHNKIDALDKPTGWYVLTELAAKKKSDPDVKQVLT